MTAFNDKQHWEIPAPPYPHWPDPRQLEVPVVNMPGKDVPVINTTETVIPVVSMMGEGPTGPKGDPLLFTDLTEEELASIYNTITYVSTFERTGSYTTEEDDEDSIPNPVTDMEPDDILFIIIDGKTLIEGVDYTRGMDGSINLANPIESAGTTVYFRALSYDLPDGDKEITINQYFNGELLVISDTDIDDVTD